MDIIKSKNYVHQKIPLRKENGQTTHWEKYLQYVYVKIAFFLRRYKKPPQINNTDKWLICKVDTTIERQHITKEDIGLSNKYRKGAHHQH